MVLQQRLVSTKLQQSHLHLNGKLVLRQGHNPCYVLNMISFEQSARLATPQIKSRTTADSRVLQRGRNEGCGRMWSEVTLVIPELSAVQTGQAPGWESRKRD